MSLATMLAIASSLSERVTRRLTHHLNLNKSRNLKHPFLPYHAVAEAMDKINDRWGEFVITPALMMGMDDIILDQISFGGVKELEEIYFN
jgi:hypothetical protein